jgi:hypothetical protein
LFPSVQTSIGATVPTGYKPNKYSRKFHHTITFATSSDIGKEKDYFITSLVGGSAILTFGLWSSKVCSFESDESGYGTYTITTLQGKSN